MMPEELNLPAWLVAVVNLFLRRISFCQIWPSETTCKDLPERFEEMMLEGLNLPAWLVAIVCFVIVFIVSLSVKLGLQRLLAKVRHGEIISDAAYLDQVLAEGARKASDIADVTLNNVYQAMGFLRS